MTTGTRWSDFGALRSMNQETQSHSESDFFEHNRLNFSIIGAAEGGTKKLELLFYPCGNGEFLLASFSLCLCVSVVQALVFLTVPCR